MSFAKIEPNLYFVDTDGYFSYKVVIIKKKKYFQKSFSLNLYGEEVAYKHAKAFKDYHIAFYDFL
jgi:hypothetical protein